jgi:hypothetical protein
VTSVLEIVFALRYKLFLIHFIDTVDKRFLFYFFSYFFTRIGTQLLRNRFYNDILY